MHRSGRHNVADPLSRNPNFKHLNALLAVTARNSTGNSVKGCTGNWSVQELHSDPASDTTASHAGQNCRRGASTPATGPNTTPLNTADNQHPADPTQPTSIDEQSATAQQPSSSETADDLHDVSWFDDFAEAYAADPDFAEDKKTPDFTFAAGLWWKGDCIVVLKSVDTKRLILQAFHAHPITVCTCLLMMGIHSIRTAALQNFTCFQPVQTMLHASLQSSVRRYPSKQMSSPCRCPKCKQGLAGKMEAYLCCSWWA